MSSKRLRTEDEELLVEIERRYAGRLTFRADPTDHHEKFVILNALSGEELKTLGSPLTRSFQAAEGR